MLRCFLDVGRNSWAEYCTSIFLCGGWNREFDMELLKSALISLCTSVLTLRYVFHVVPMVNVDGVVHGP